PSRATLVPLAAESTSGPSRSHWPADDLVCSAEKGSHVSRFRYGRFIHPFLPSNTCTAVLPANSSSMRDLSGRFISSTNGNWTCFSAACWCCAFSIAAPRCLADCIEALLTYLALRAAESPKPTSILPFHAIDCRLCQACKPPRAAICFWTTCAAVTPAGAVLPPSAHSAAGRHRLAKIPSSTRPLVDI